MKTYRFITMLTVLILLCSCSSDNNNLVTDDTEVKTSLDINTKNGSKSLSNLFETGPTVRCTGECTSDTNSKFGCVVNFSFDTPHLVRCACEGCAMTITTDLSNGLVEYSEIAETGFLIDLGNYIHDEYNVTDVYAESIRLFQAGDSYVVSIEFYDLEDKLQSVSLQMNLDFGNKFIIDCRGDCNEPSEMCSEYFNMNTGEASCTCAGSCNMTVTQVPDTGLTR
jgi:hypothetical protein